MLDIAKRIGGTILVAAMVAPPGIRWPAMGAAAVVVVAATAVTEVTIVPRLLAAVAPFQHITCAPDVDRLIPVTIPASGVHKPRVWLYSNTGVHVGNSVAANVTNNRTARYSESSKLGTENWTCPPRFMCVSAASLRTAVSHQKRHDRHGGWHPGGKAMLHAVLTRFADIIGDDVVLEVSPSNWMWRAVTAAAICEGVRRWCLWFGHRRRARNAAVVAADAAANAAAWRAAVGIRMTALADDVAALRDGMLLQQRQQQQRWQQEREHWQQKQISRGGFGGGKDYGGEAALQAPSTPAAVMDAQSNSFTDLKEKCPSSRRRGNRRNR